MTAAKFIAIFLGVLVLAIIDIASCSEEDERIKAIYSKCKEETQIDENEMETFRRMELPNSTKGKCMMGCLMREASIIVNGRFYKDGAVRVAERYYADRRDELEKAKMVIDICEKKIEYETEECEIAGQLASCVIEEAQKYPQKSHLAFEIKTCSLRNWKGSPWGRLAYRQSQEGKMIYYQHLPRSK